MRAAHPRGSRSRLSEVMRGPVSSRKARQPVAPAADSVEPAVLRYLARRDRTEAQVRAFLLRAGASPARSRVVIAGLLRQGYLNDEAYALRWARARLARRPMGRLRLEVELLNQGLDREITASTVEQVYRERPERDLARQLLGLPKRQGQPGSRLVEAGLLRRHGFDDEMIEDLLGGGQLS
ncbi:MAG: hypothetical protein FJ246_10000 [Nitrospira sp.]|nr:hypothetical protein [Nitrospira sp.]